MSGRHRNSAQRRCMSASRCTLFAVLPWAGRCKVTSAGTRYLSFRAIPCCSWPSNCTPTSASWAERRTPSKRCPYTLYIRSVHHCVVLLSGHCMTTHCIPSEASQRVCPTATRNLPTDCRCPRRSVAFLTRASAASMTCSESRVLAAAAAAAAVSPSLVPLSLFHCPDRM